MELIDLRSDTVTRPTPGMRKAMSAAEVGDDVYGEDPTVNLLQERVAALLGLEAALWTPTGTMANQIALGSLAGAGDEVICDRNAHVVHYEGGAISALWGAQSLVLDGERGRFGAAALEAVLRRSDDVHAPRQRAVALENTHNRGGGAVWPLAQQDAVLVLARSAGLAAHLDGARLWNAHVATGTPLSRLCQGFETVSVCLSKGLGAPAGSVVATTRERLPLLLRLRKRLGGGLRQAGILAAAGLYALDHHVERLVDDHRSAQRLAEGLGGIPGFSPQRPETNIVLVGVEVKGGAQALVAAARAEGVLCNPTGPSSLRLVTHLDFSAKRVDDAVRALAAAARRCG